METIQVSQYESVSSLAPLNNLFCILLNCTSKFSLNSLLPNALMLLVFPLFPKSLN